MVDVTVRSDIVYATQLLNLFERGPEKRRSVCVSGGLCSDQQTYHKFSGKETEQD